MSEFKTYVLLDEMNPQNNNLYRRIGKTQRERIDKRRDFGLHLRSTVVKDGKRVVIRYKETSNDIEQDKQIKDGILANAPFTNGEYATMNFLFGTKTTNDPVVQEYIETYAGFEGNNFTSPDVSIKQYKLLDFQKEAKNLNETTRRRVQAASKIIAFNLDETKDRLWKAYGTNFTPSEDVEVNQNTLIKYLDESEDAVKEILDDSTNVDDEVKILLGKAIAAKNISFNQTVGQVSRKKGEVWQDIKAISSDLSSEERISLFSEFLTSDAGKLLKDDIEKDLKKSSKTK